MKSYIRDNGKSRRCPSNIAKMNMFEYYWYSIRYWHHYENEIRDVYYAMRHVMRCLFDILSFFLLLIDLVIPVFSLIVAQQIINESKRAVRK